MIFCVEDDTGIRDIEVYTLKATGFDAHGFADAASLFDALKTNLPKLIILDIMLPGEDGVRILEKIKSNVKTKDIPVIMATAKNTEYDKVKVLDLGADDYLVKPFGMMEMVARVKAVLRRANSSNNSSILQVGAITMNLVEHTVTAGDERVLLTLKEYEILRVFMSHPGMVFTRDVLLTDIWGMDYDGETRTVDVHIRTLRQKLGEFGDMIETVRGVGYRMGV